MMQHMLKVNFER